MLRILIFVLLLAGVASCTWKMLIPDYESPVISYVVGDYYTTFKHRDSADCIKLNTRIMTDNSGYDYSGGVYDTIEGRPVCGVKGIITTQDLKHYVVYFNRFERDLAEKNADIANNTVKCNEDRTRCRAGYGMKNVFKQD